MIFRHQNFGTIYLTGDNTQGPFKKAYCKPDHQPFVIGYTPTGLTASLGSTVQNHTTGEQGSLYLSRVTEQQEAKNRFSQDINAQGAALVCSNMWEKTDVNDLQWVQEKDFPHRINFTAVG